MIQFPEDEQKRAENGFDFLFGDSVDSWTIRQNPNPIVRPEAQQTMNKLFQLDNQFWTKQNIKLTSYDVCPKGISCRDQKSLSPGVFYNCPVEHNTLGGDYVCDPYSQTNFSIANPSSGKVKSSRALPKKKTRPTCRHCSLINFNHEEPAVVYENYVQQCSMAHLPPEGPPVDKPIEQTIMALRSALKNGLDDPQSYGSVRNVLLPGSNIETDLFHRWLEELKTLLNPANIPNPSECKAPSKRGSRMSLNRVRPRVPRHIIKPLLAARKAKSAMLDRKVKSSVLRSHPVVKTESRVQKPIINAKFSNIKSRYLNPIKPLIMPEQQHTEQSITNAEVQKETRSNPVQSVLLQSLLTKSQKPASQSVPISKPMPAVKSSGDSGKKKTVVKKKVFKFKRSANKFKTGTRRLAKVKRKKKLKPMVASADVAKSIPTSKKTSIVKKKTKASKKNTMKPVKVKSCGFEFRLSDASLKTKSKPKSKKAGVNKDLYRAYILEMLEKDTGNSETKSFSTKYKDKEGNETQTTQSESLTTVTGRPKFKHQSVKKVTVLYKNSNVADGVDAITSSLGLAAISSTSKLASSKNSKSKGPTNENKKSIQAKNSDENDTSILTKSSLPLQVGVELLEIPAVPRTSTNPVAL